jgi:hypothetical protein
MHYIIIAEILSTMGVGTPQQNFFVELMTYWLAVRGRFNFVNISRYGPWHERTLRRWFKRGFAWERFNAMLMKELIPDDHEIIVALDATFVPKSGKETAGLGYFFSGCAGRALKGLELSLVSIVDVTANTAYALDARQTPPGANGGKVGRRGCKAARRRPTSPDEETRVDAYVEQMKRIAGLLPSQVRYLAVDGYYTRQKFVAGVRALGLELIGKLRRDAAAWYLYDGPQKPRGRRRQRGDKVVWSQLDLTRWKNHGKLDEETRLYSTVLYHRSLKRALKVALVRYSKGGKHTDALLYSTDLDLSATDILRYYKARFQIEFLFRDAKQGAGLSHCQARSVEALHFHWNAALCAVNLAKQPQSRQAARPTFSLASVKQRHANEHLLDLFSVGLGLNLTFVKSHPAYTALCDYGVIAI